VAITRLARSIQGLGGSQVRSRSRNQEVWRTGTDSVKRGAGVASAQREMTSTFGAQGNRRENTDPLVLRGGKHEVGGGLLGGGGGQKGGGGGPITPVKKKTWE